MFKYLDELGGKGAVAGLKVLLEVLVNKFEDKVESSLTLNNVSEPVYYT
jgi:hypothetical protein